jgi:hypothetical protein
MDTYNIALRIHIIFVDILGMIVLFSRRSYSAEQGYHYQSFLSEEASPDSRVNRLSAFKSLTENINGKDLHQAYEETRIQE